MSVSNFLNKLKTKPDIWFFSVFLLTFTLNIRKVLFYFPQQGTFNEYTGIYVYMSDIFLLLTIGLWLISLYYNNIFKLSRDKLWITYFFSKKYLIIPLALVIWSFISIFWSSYQSIAFFRSIKLLEFYLLYLYVIFRFSPFFFIKQDYDNKIKEGEKILEVNQLNVLKNVPRGTFFNFKYKEIIRYFFLTIVGISVIQSIIAINQVIIQKSVGLGALRESFISPSLPGVAKVILGGDKYIRAYGLMPHPNILGGFLLFSIVISLLYLKLFHVEQFAFVEKGGMASKKDGSKSNRLVGLKMFHVEQFQKKSSFFNSVMFHVEHFKKKYFSPPSSQEQIVPRGTILSKIWYVVRWRGMMKVCFLDSYIFIKKFVKKDKWLIKAFILIQVLALFLSFSKSAIIGLVISLIYIVYKLNVPRGTFILQWKKIRLVTSLRYFRISILMILVICSFIIIFLKPDFNTVFFQSLRERLFYLNVSRGTILSSPILGIGSGQFVINIPYFSQNVVLPWEYQPVHNVFLLVWSELGIIGVVLFSWFILKLFHVEQFNLLKKDNLTSKKDENKNKKFLGLKMFHVEHFEKKESLLHVVKETIVPRGTNEHFEKNRNKEINSIAKRNKKDNILYNKNRYLSMNYLLIYFQGILLGFVFIMLFDHYLWDIQQGSVLFWLVCGFIVGNKKVC